MTSYEDFIITPTVEHTTPFFRPTTNELTIISSDHTFFRPITPFFRPITPFFRPITPFFVRHCLKYFETCHGLKCFIHLYKKTSYEGTEGINLPYCSSNKKLSIKCWSNNYVTFSFFHFPFYFFIILTSNFS